MLTPYWRSLTPGRACGRRREGPVDGAGEGLRTEPGRASDDARKGRCATPVRGAPALRAAPADLAWGAVRAGTLGLPGPAGRGGS
ncbi:hypothetical protein GCM10010512_06480 [Streptomyces thermoviolaceus subsp. thermoviolaceus]|nr:hypothetical protein GCM10010512_06480 [Streptomyces thermoviolaceus subsp. thermoviolaceus]